MNRKKRILILTADAGFGHRSAANAVSAALKAKYSAQIHVDVINPLEDKRTPALLRDSQADYDKLVRKAPELYRLGYDASDTTVTSAILESALTVMLFEVMRELLRKYRPDVIFSTYPLYQAPLAAVFSVFKTYVPLLAVVTDLVSVHRMWFNNNVDTLLVPTRLVEQLALEAGVPPEKIHITGIPVHPRIAEEKRSAAEIRASLGWQPDILTVLAVGSKRVESLLEVLHVINHFGLRLQLVVVCGKDQDMYRELKQVTWHIPVHLYEYTQDMPAFMHGANLIVCKAGGLIVTEALACGLPMVLVNVIPGQETGNMKYVVENGAGHLVQNPIQMLETLAHLTMNDQLLLAEQAAHARRLGHPLAAYDAADLTVRAAGQAPVRREGSGRKSLLDLLTNNQVAWSDNEPLTGEEKPT